MPACRFARGLNVSLSIEGGEQGAQMVIFWKDFHNAEDYLQSAGGDFARLVFVQVYGSFVSWAFKANSHHFAVLDEQAVACGDS